MAGFLFHDVIFGPVRSRRLGLSLGINLLPKHVKYCSFDCVYCECGWTPVRPEKGFELPDREEVMAFLEHRLRELAAEDYLPDTLTFAGNGEPTLHPFFPDIVEDTILLRNRYAPSSSVAVLSNGSMTQVPETFQALEKLDLNIQKLDAGSEKIFRLMNQPIHPVKFSDLVENLHRFNGKVIIQSLFIRGNVNGKSIDNTGHEEIQQWIEKIGYIRPKMVMIYPIARETPSHGIEKVPFSDLEKIAGEVRQIGIETKVYG